jgi:photosynthetic reaction center cytochrome c subunit
MFRWKLPDWYKRWKEDNPITMGSLMGPLILFGAGFFAWIGAIAIMVWYSWADPQSLQTGPRGAGMSVASLAALEKTDETIEAYYSEEPYAPEADEPLAKEVYKNVQVLGDLTEGNFTRLMVAMTEWVSPEQGCAYCHDEENLHSDKVYTKVVSRRMIQMTRNINENWDGHVNVSGNDVGVNCYTCHRGQNVPSDIWFRIAPQLEAASGWAANQNYATDQSVSTSLPHDALEMLLGTDENLIAVHDLEPRVKTDFSDPEHRSIQHTERTYSLMNYFSNSLGVNCTFCHNTRAFYDTEQVTPQWGTAMQGIGMVRELNMEYLDPLKDTYPENRLGPMHRDAPKAACKTCHKGYSKPMGGTPMLTDWPELAAEGPPEYQQE